MTTLAAGWQARLKVTLPRVIRAEWIKFWSLRSTWITLLATVVAFIGIGMIASSVSTGGGPPEGPGGGPVQATDPAGLSLAGSSFAQLILGTLGVLVVASEYSTGMIRSTLAGVPKRLPVLWAKILVFAGAAFVLSLLAALVAFFGGQAVLGDEGVSLSDPGVLRAVIGTAVYVTGAGVLGLALGALLRSTAAAIATMFGLLFILPGVSGLLLPDSWSDAITPYLPSNAGSAFTAVAQGTNQLGPWAGLAVFSAYVLVAITGAAWLLKKRDA